MQTDIFLKHIADGRIEVTTDYDTDHHLMVTFTECGSFEEIGTIHYDVSSDEAIDVSYIFKMFTPEQITEIVEFITEFTKEQKKAFVRWIL